ncbi:lytic transglycosylase domain-containing protein [Roseomonas sp. OT10]|uniref:lytic transglycosylase domain-containing protein n=1 Tax=Roseomonas cutis TaxID=2897332 RepID=UPI001E468046|nr:lytic transglycosylase domain-containing protein [Roseomonas sp. OT10]UFN48346.1 lytic transglycosylase domain-containing protein [Roseomonas sp. OT10]
MAPAGADRCNLLARWRGVATLSLLTLVAACGSQPTTSGPTTRASASMHRPASYDPPGPAGDPWGPYVREASRRFDVPERWIREVMRQESAGRATATSPVGAMGLMQVMPGTYAELRYKHGLGDDPYHPYDSIMAGTAYIRQMYDLYGSPGFLAAYNAGPRRLEDYLWANRGMPAETRNYVARIGPRIIDAHPNRRAPPEVYAAAEIPLNIPAGPRRMDSATMLALREQREQRRQADQPAVQMASLPAGPVVRMEPIPDGSTRRVQVASLGVAGLGPNVVAMEPIPDGTSAAAVAAPTLGRNVIAMDPIPDGSTGPAPVASAAAASLGPNVVAMAPIPDGSTGPAPAVAEEPAPRPAPRFAEQPTPRSLPTPPAFATAPAPPPRTQFAAARTPAPAPNFPAPASGPFRNMALIPAAQASTLPSGMRGSPAPAVAATGGNWAVQVGAFASENLARAAANQAKGSIPGANRVAVQAVSQGRSTLYRARVIGLSREGAQGACEKLRARGACMALSPDAQS